MLEFFLKMMCGVIIVQWLVLYHSSYFILVLLWLFSRFKSRLKVCFKE